MKVINIHTRTIRQPPNQIAELFKTLSSEDDKMLDTRRWSPMVLNNGLKVGSKGGHGPISYVVREHKEGEFIEFEFTKPAGFLGFHRFEIKDSGDNTTELTHLIEMKTKGWATVQWLIAIRWLHDAFMEDAFDKVENQFLTEKKRSEWSSWVKLLRKVFKPRNK